MIREEESRPGNLTGAAPKRGNAGDKGTAVERAIALDRLLDLDYVDDGFENFDRPAPEEVKTALRAAIRNFVWLHPEGLTLRELAKEFEVSVGKVHSALKDTDESLPPVPVKALRGKRMVYVWKYPQSADEYAEYLRSCMGSTIGDIRSMAALSSAVALHFGDFDYNLQAAIGGFRRALPAKGEY